MEEPLPSSGVKPHPPLGGILALTPPPACPAISSTPQDLYFSFWQGVQRQQIKLPNFYFFFFFKDVPSLWLPWQHLLASLKSVLSSLHGLSSLPHCALLLHTPALALPISAPPWAPPPPPGQASSLGMAQAGAEEDFRGTQSTGR